MEYNLLKTIENSVGGNFIPNEKYPRLSPYPATDFVNPGLGQISRLYNFYVPLPTNYNLHQINKKITNVSDNLEGFGKVDSDKTNVEEDSTIGEEDPIEFNEIKRSYCIIRIRLKKYFN